MDNKTKKEILRCFEKLDDKRYILGEIMLQGIKYYISEDRKIYLKDDEKYTLVEDLNTINLINKVIYPPSNDIII